MNKTLIFCVLLFGVLSMAAQTQKIEHVDIAGVVYDELDDTFIGVTVIIKNKPGAGTVTNIDGTFKMNVSLGDVLVFSMIGYKSQEYLILKSQNDIKIKLELAEHQLAEAVVTGMGSSQRRISIVGAVTSVDTKELQTPATSLANMLGGRVAGIISRQNSGEPGENTSEFWIRGIGTFGGGSVALVLIDGLEGSLGIKNK